MRLGCRIQLFVGAENPGFSPISVCVQSWRSYPFLAAARLFCLLHPCCPGMFDPRDPAAHPGLKSIVMLKSPALEI